MKNIYGETHQQLEQYFLDLGEKKFKATQVFEWLYEKRVSSFEEMSNVKKSVIQVLQRDYVMEPLKIMDILTDVDVHKYLFQLSDGEKVEAVLMKHDYGNSICVSTQVGCNMGCTFCESGRLKKRRNLEAYEMVLQLLMVEEHLGERISHVVLMGIGEPLDNYDNVINFIKIINDAKGIQIGARHITLSTCGLVPKIYELSKMPIQINLAISFHAPTDELRNKLMPVNKVYSIDTLIKAIKDYLQVTSRRVKIVSTVVSRNEYLCEFNSL